MNNPRNLVIVESPGKIKTIEKFLGPDYKVLSSYGHIRDLKKHSFSIDVDDNFSPLYEIPHDKQALVAELKQAADNADIVWLASDEDREGEAIAWHLYEVLKLTPQKTRRIVFHEITRKAILHAIEHPRSIDLARVDAQQARRVLDRIVGFELSPVLWKRLRPSLSAGRVQSVAVRLIVDREEEIRNFVSEPYYRITAQFTPDDKPDHVVNAELSERLPSEQEALHFLEDCKSADFSVGDVDVHPLRKSPAPPFTTSTLQQEAARKLGFSVSQTMSLAQKLYENGHITYMRTDSVNLSDDALAAMESLIKEKIGTEYYHRRIYHTSAKGAQEAHEAIRPTYVNVEMPEGLSQHESKLYALIRRRAVASQMADAQVSKTTVRIQSPGLPYSFTATDETVIFDGFLKVYAESTDDEEPESLNNPGSGLTEGMAMQYRSIDALEKFTQQPPRYTEASLVKKMEELGIGRPSTTATIITTIQQRQYVEKGEDEGTPRSFRTITLENGSITEGERVQNVGSNKGRLVPTDVGIIVNSFLKEYFPDILDFNFTANVEEKFDEIARGELKWNDEIGDFYTVFHPAVDEAMTIRQGPKFGERSLGVDPATGRPVSVKIGKFGPVVQIGSPDENEKPTFASLRKGQSINTITLEEALKLFEFPRILGDYEGKDVQVAIGRFGPYVRHDNKFVSVPKDIQPAELTIEQAIELIEAKRRQEKERVILTFDKDSDLQVLKGRFGPYIAYNGNNYKLPRTIEDPASLTYEAVKAIVDATEPTSAKGRKKTASKKKK